MFVPHLGWVLFIILDFYSKNGNTLNCQQTSKQKLKNQRKIIKLKIKQKKCGLPKIDQLCLVFSMNSAASQGIAFAIPVFSVSRKTTYYGAGWWFGTFPYIGNNNPNWLIFFRGVETTNQWFNVRKTDRTTKKNYRKPLSDNHRKTRGHMDVNDVVGFLRICTVMARNTS